MDSTSNESTIESTWLSRNQGHLRGHEGIAEKANQEGDSQTLWLEEVLNRIPVGLMLIEPGSGQIRSVNEEGLRIFNYVFPYETISDIEKVPFEVYDMHDQRLAPHEWPLMRAARGETIKDEVIRSMSPDGAVYLNLNSSFIPALHDQNPVFVVTFSDVSVRIKAEKSLIKSEERLRINEARLRRAKETADAANAAKSEFLANMSHEIRTPLTAIMGYSMLLETETLSPEEIAHYVEVINRNGRSLTTLVDDILDLSKIEAGKISIKVGACSVRAIIADVLSIFKHTADSHGVKLHASIADSVPLLMETDPVRLRQILINIVGNAVKFTSQGHVKIDVTSETLKNGKENLRIEIEDTGIGLTPQDASRLFKPFVQIDNKASRKFQGTGLGLVLAKKLAQALGGDITILRSRPGEGSLFLVTIGMHRSEDFDKTKAATFPEDKDAAPVSEALNGTRILLAEDSADTRWLVANMLESLGAKVETAENGLEALEKAKRTSFDVILMDIQMPVMDGFEALKKLRALHYPSPVIALTAHAMAEEMAKTSEAGFHCHITKPIAPAELIACIKKLTTESLRSKT